MAIDLDTAQSALKRLRLGFAIGLVCTVSILLVGVVVTDTVLLVLGAAGLVFVLNGMRLLRKAGRRVAHQAGEEVRRAD